MTSQEALQLLDQVAANVTANRETHQQIQLAITVLRAEIERATLKPNPEKQKG